MSTHTESTTIQVRDWMGEINEVRMLGKVELSTPEFNLYLMRLSSNPYNCAGTFRVHYGLQHKFFGDIADALDYFKSCYLHAVGYDSYED